MSRRNKIDQIPPSLRAKIVEMMATGETLDDIMQRLKLKDKHGISRSGLGRYKQVTDKLSTRLREQRAMAEVIVASGRSDLDSKSARLNVQLLHSLITDIVAASESGEPLTAADVRSIAQALSNLSSAEARDIDMIAKLRQQAREEAAAAMDAQLEAMAKNGRNLSEMSVSELKEALRDGLLNKTR